MRPLVPAQGGVTVAWKPSAFNDKVFCADFGDDLAITEILVCMLDELPDRFLTEGVVFAHAEYQGQGFQVEVPRKLWASKHWHSIVPVPDRTRISLTLHLAPGRGRGSGGVFRLVASIAIIAAAAAVSAGALGPITGGLLAAGSIGASVAGAGVGILGSLALSALSPPPQFARQQEGESRNELGSASANGNLLERAGVIPRAIGTFRMFPPFAFEPLIEIIGKDEWLEVGFCANGPHESSDIRVNDVPIDSIEGIEYEVRDGYDVDTAITLVERRAHTETPGLELDEHDVNLEDGQELRDQADPENSIPKWNTATFRRNLDEGWLHLFFAEGLLATDDPEARIGVPVRLRMRQRGAGTDWINFPEIHFAGRGAVPFRKAIKLIWDQSVPGTLPVPAIDYAPVYAFKEVPTQSITPVGIGGWSADSYFSDGSGNDVYMSGTETTTNVANTALYDDRVEFFLDPDVHPVDVVWEIQLLRGLPYGLETFDPATYIYDAPNIVDFFGYWTDTGTHKTIVSLQAVHSKIMLLRVASVQNEHPIGGAGLWLLAIKVKNTAIQKVSALLSGLVEDWDGSEWTGNVATSNPAAHFRHILIGDQTADPLPEALLEDLSDWHTHCANQGYEANLIADGQNIEELLNVIAGCGYARLRRSETWGVFMERDRSSDSPVQIFSPRTMRNFRWSKALARRPHGLRLRYRSRDLDYEEAEELIVYDEGYDSSTATLLEGAEYQGLVSESENQARAIFDLAQARLRDVIYSAEVDAEALVARRGDLVGVQHDTIHHAAGFARILEVLFDGGLVSGIVLDSKVPTNLEGDFFSHGEFFTTEEFFEDDGTTGAAIRLRDGSGDLLVKEIDADVGETETLMFETPFADPGTFTDAHGDTQDRLGAGCHVVTGQLNSEYRRLIIADMKPGPDLTFAIAMVDEAEDLFPPISLVGQPLGLLLALTRAV